jgi:hypothetical protein
MKNLYQNDVTSKDNSVLVSGVGAGAQNNSNNAY